MSDQVTQITGSCLCGKVAYSAKVKTGAGACHCHMCRRWSGGLYMSVHALGKVEFQGAENIQNYESSEWAERGFCTQCGSSLYYFLKPRPGVPDGETMLVLRLIMKSMLMQHRVGINLQTKHRDTA